MSGGPVALPSDANAARYQKRRPMVHLVDLCCHLVAISQFISQEHFQGGCVCVCACVRVHIKCVCVCVCVYAYQVFSKREPYSKLFSYDTKMSSAFLLSSQVYSGIFRKLHAKRYPN